MNITHPQMGETRRQDGFSYIYGPPIQPRSSRNFDVHFKIASFAFEAFTRVDKLPALSPLRIPRETIFTKEKRLGSSLTNTYVRFKIALRVTYAVLIFDFSFFSFGASHASLLSPNAHVCSVRARLREEKRQTGMPTAYLTPWSFLTLGEAYFLRDV